MSADVERIDSLTIARIIEETPAYIHRGLVTTKALAAAEAILASEWLRDALAAARREGQRDGWDEGRKAGADFERARWVGAGVIGVPRPEIAVLNPYRDNQTGATR
jgi:hypothetical protein